MREPSGLGATSLGHCGKRRIMLRKIVLVAVAGVVAALLAVGIASAAPTNKNSITVGMECDHGVGAITGASIDQNNAGTFILDPGPGTYVVKVAFIEDQFAYVNPGFA